MKQVDIEAMAKDLSVETSFWDYPIIARKVASQLTRDISQLAEHLSDNPEWWETLVDMRDEEDCGCRQASLSEVVYNLIFGLAYDACQKSRKVGRNSNARAR